MEHKENQNLHALTQFMDTQFLMKFTKFLLSVSVFSFFFSYSSLLSFLHSFNFYFSTFPYQLATHTVDKNCIFLLCNGLVVFLAKYSGLIRFLSRSNRPDHESYESIIDVSSLESSVPVTKEMILEKEIAEESINGPEEIINVVEQESDQNECLIKEHEQEEGSGSMVSKFEEEQEPERSSIVSNEEEDETVIYVEEDEEEDCKSSKGDFDLVGQQAEVEEEEEEEEEGNGMLSTEELNKKFDEFIRRMKEEIRIEAQRQLIMV